MAQTMRVIAVLTVCSTRCFSQLAATRVAGIDEAFRPLPPSLHEDDDDGGDDDDPSPTQLSEMVTVASSNITPILLQPQAGQRIAHWHAGKEPALSNMAKHLTTMQQTSL